MSFSAFGLDDRIIANIPKSFSEATPIQEQAIPAVLTGKDLLGLAQTGTGKTAAFLLPILHRLLEMPGGKARALVLAPTRELVDQIVEEAQTWARGTGLHVVGIYGGVNYVGQIKKLKRGPEIIIACPGRMLDHMAKKSLDYSKIQTLVLDEADQMFDMGFLPTVRRILDKLPEERQNLLFSATMPKEVAHLAEEILQEPLRVEIQVDSTPDTITHSAYHISQNKKDGLLLSLIPQLGSKSILIFTRTKHRAKSLSAVLRMSGYEAEDLQGNLSQGRRREVMSAFRSGECRILVATDIAARGIDVSRVSHVVNYDMPDTLAAYTHRTGRTGRAKREGDAISFLSKGDEWFLRAAARHLDVKPALHALPEIDEKFLHVRRDMPQDERPMRKPGRNTERSTGRSTERNAGRNTFRPSRFSQMKRDKGERSEKSQDSFDIKAAPKRGRNEDSRKQGTRSASRYGRGHDPKRSDTRQKSRWR